jgi:predicted RNA-binding protein with PUA-like domain
MLMPAKKRTAKKKAATKNKPPTTTPTTRGTPKPGGAWDAVFTPRAAGEKRYWLVKSEPEVFSFDDLLRIHNKTTNWNGVRNFAARNFMKDGMKLGDRVFFYHSMSGDPGIVGICEVVREAYPDDTALDPSNEYHDPKSTRENPIWFMVDLRAVAQLTHPVTLAQIKAREELANMALVRIGRLSVSPVTRQEWDTICRMAEQS